MRIVLMGPPGAGKGTLAKQLVEKFQMVHLSSGDILRVERSSGSPLGQQLAEYMDVGKLVPDETVVAVMAKALTSNSDDSGLLLDGFPRTVAQAKELDEQLARAEVALDAVVVMNAEPEIVVDRITGRRSCPSCGEIYHVVGMKPKAEGICDVCGAGLIQRDDDKAEVVRQRLEAYRQQTEPVIDYYRQSSLAMVEVDGNQPAGEVALEVISALENVGARN